MDDVSLIFDDKVRSLLLSLVSSDCSHRYGSHYWACRGKHSRYSNSKRMRNTFWPSGSTGLCGDITFDTLCALHLHRKCSASGSTIISIGSSGVVNLQRSCSNACRAMGKLIGSTVTSVRSKNGEYSKSLTRRSVLTTDEAAERCRFRVIPPICERDIDHPDLRASADQ
jgi:hypothetical protein